MQKILQIHIDRFSLYSNHQTSEREKNEILLSVALVLVTARLD